MRTLDIDQLQTFLAVAEEGGFTRASERVFKTQSAVSMQIKKLEDQIGRSLFLREGRTTTLTADGRRLRDYAARMLRLNEEAWNAFHCPELSGVVRLGLPDDYADRLLPKILASFARSHSAVEIEVTCQASDEISERIRDGEVDMAIVTHGDMGGFGRIIRREPLVWVVADCFCAHKVNPVPLALGPESCSWRQQATRGLDRMGRDWRIAYTSGSNAALLGAVSAGLAISVIPQSAIRADIHVLTPADGFPALEPCDIALLRAEHANGSVFDALEDHIIRGIGNLTALAEAAE